MARFEILERRWVLASPTLGAIADLTAPLLAPVPVLLDGADTDGDKLTYTVTSSNSSVVQPILLSDTNPTLKFTGIHDGNKNYGDMSFQLFQDLAPLTTARITDLVNARFYNGLTFHRIARNSDGSQFVIQGGDPLGTGGGGSGVTFDDEYNANLQFTTKGILAMAKSTDDSNDSQFFITGGVTRHLDFQHSIFGFLIDGENVRNTLNSVATDSSSRPLSALDMGTVTVQAADGQHRVLLLKTLQAPSGSQPVTITVKADDGHGGVFTRTFKVTPAADTNANSPFMASFAPVSTSVGRGVVFNIPTTNVEGGAINYSGKTLDSNSTISINPTTGQTTVTPNSGFVGVAGIELWVTPEGVTPSSDAVRDRQDVAVLVNPAAPASVTLLSTLNGDAHSTTANNSPGNPIKFRVSGVTAGYVVTIYADGNAIGSATVPTGATSVDVTTSSQSTLSPSVHTFVATQTLKDQVYTVGNEKNKHVDLASGASTGVDVLVVRLNTPPTLGAIADIATAEGQTASFVATATDADLPDDTLRYSLVTGAPAGATIDPNTARFSYTAGEADGGNTYHITVRVTDSAGATSDKSFAMSVAEVQNPPVLTQIPPLTTAASNSTVQLQVTAVDPDSNPNPIAYSLEPGAPAGMSINASSGVITWNVPDTQAAGLVTVHVRATERPAGGSAGMSSTAAVQLSVSNLDAQFALALALAQLTSASSQPVAFPIANAVFDSGPASTAASVVGTYLPLSGDTRLFGSDRDVFLTGGDPRKLKGLPSTRLKEPTLEEKSDKNDLDNGIAPPASPRSDTPSREQRPKSTSRAPATNADRSEAADVVFETLGEEELAAAV